MGQHYGRVAVISALLVLPWVSFAVPPGSQPTASPEIATAKDTAVVDAAEAERRGFQALGTDDAQSVQWFERAASAGRPAAQWALGTQYFDGKGVTKDVTRAVELMRAAAAQSFAPAQSFLGWMYLEATGVERDTKQAFEWFNAAARQEDAYALRMLAGFYYSGVATKQDRELSKRLMLRAAELGDVESQISAYSLLLYGPTEGRDPRLGIHFLTKAAQAKDARAAYLLGREHLRANGVQHDPAEGVQWLQRSADAGNAMASLWLSELHFKGLGVTRDSARAEKLLSDALTRASIQEKNDFAWELSVGEDERLRDGLLAVRVLEPALAAVTEKFPAHVDTLAAAYAEIKQFDRAVLTQQSAIDRAKRERSPQETISGMVERLRLYERGEPYREIAP
jgi:TPR repeat protein